MMENLKKLRTPLRSGFSRIANQLDKYLETENPDQDEVEILLNQLNDKWYILDTKEREIHDLLVNDVDCSQETFDSEYNHYESYKENYIRLKTKVDKFLKTTMDDNKSCISETVSKRRFKLPKVELKKFNGEVKEWLGFWGQFKKIHEDSEIAPEDKFIYLSQSTVEGSRARELVDSFPPSAENYEQAIECLKARFGREDLLIEVYVRELLSLVLNNSMNQKKTRIANLYDKIESHIRALDSLGVTSDKYASILYPLVESCLPEEIIRIWERNITYKNETVEKSNKLIALMKFLKSEVEGEERITIAKEGFGLDSRRKSKLSFSSTINTGEEKVPTAVGLFDATSSNKPICVFCERKNHESYLCRCALKMSLDDKRKILSKRACCFLCLKVGHRARDCRFKINCEKCKGRHYTVMCNGGKPKEKESKEGEYPRSNVNTSGIRDNLPLINDTSLGNRTCNKEILLQTMHVWIRGKRGRRIIRALIDTGSQRSYISKRIVKEMNYDFIKEENVIHSLFGGKEHPEKHLRYRVFLSSLSEDYHCNFEVLDQQRICSDIPISKLEVCSKELVDKDIIVTDQLIPEKDRLLEIDLLIGSDVAGKLLNGRVVQLTCGLVAVGTLLGWTLMGKIPYEDNDENSTMVVTNLFLKDATISQFWDLDVIGITDSASKHTKEERDLRTKVEFQNSVLVNNEGRYEVALPWSENHMPLPTNKDVAIKRLKSTTQKLYSQDLYTAYDEIFKNWHDLGIIEEVETNDTNDVGHYLPHRPVIKESSTTPVRPVFDASARSKFSPSLNQCLECGPNLIELIPSLILKFREGKYAAIADIEKAFLQISVRPEDRNYLRFFWWKSANENELKIFRHTRVVFGVKSSPFLLAAVIEYHLLKYIKHPCYDERLINKLIHSFYVDNVVSSFDNEHEMKQFIEVSQKIMYEGMFNLRGWYCTGEDLHTEKILPVLGLLWNLQEDTLTVNMSWLDNYELEKITKRIILAITHKIFDPVGFTSPVFLLPKILLQNLWKTGISWDSEVDETTRERFLKWYQQLFLLKGISIPRWIHADTNKKSCTIHTFCDASSNAYAAAVFVRIQTSTEVKIHLLASKSRVAPIKLITIPRLELIAATIGARLCTSVLESLQWKNVELYYWTDSMTVLAWIQREENWTVFVGNRVREIRQLTNPNAWRHIPGKDNPADLPSRGCTAKQLLEVRWWEGPMWLKKDPIEWPTSKIAIYNCDEINREKRKSVILNTQINFETTEMFSRISTYKKLIRVIAWIYRFYFNIKSKISRRVNSIDLKEINYAELIVFKIVQQEAFPKGVNEECIKILHPVLDENGLLRVKTRIFYRKDKKNFRLPILLPSKHKIVNMLIIDRHNELGHPGVQILMNHLRENYWILQSRKTIRQVILRCIRCRRFTATHPDPISTPLPENRVRDATVFEIIGVDLAGPLHLKDETKAWIVLYTCAVYRAIHLELISSLTAESFLQSLRRFIARRGRPMIIFSDNASNFVKAHSEFSKIDWNKIEAYSTTMKIAWKFIPPSAPWWGGWWERLVGMTKQILRRVLGQALLSYEELNTVLCDTESLINSRPLTYLSEDINDLVAISPSMFLHETRENGVPDIDKIDNIHMRKRLLYIQRIREDLRKRFRLEYLGQLKYTKKNNENSNSISVGDIVLLGSDNLKRLMWPIARVVEVIPGRDNVVRVVKLRTKFGFVTRPIQRIYPLELSNNTEGLLLRSKASKSKQSVKNRDWKGHTPIEKHQSVETKVSTRSGRTVKPIQKLNL